MQTSHGSPETHQAVYSFFHLLLPENLLMGDTGD